MDGCEPIPLVTLPNTVAAIPGLQDLSWPTTLVAEKGQKDQPEHDHSDGFLPACLQTPRYIPHSDRNVIKEVIAITKSRSLNQADKEANTRIL
jgi:hypothetical protein